MTSVVLLAGSVLPAQTGTGLKADYYPNVKLEGAPALSRVDATVDFQWNSGSPGTGVPADKFSTRWHGKVQVPSNGVYTFFTRSDDGVRLWVNGRLLINNWTGHSPTYDQGVPVALLSGRKYDIQLEYFESGGGATMQLMWSYGTQARQVIPKGQLFPDVITLVPPPIPVSKVWLSDLNWLSAKNGWGPPELDRSNGETGDDDGKRIRIADRSYGHGVGVHAVSELRYALDDRYDVFKAIIGVDDEVGDRGSVIFEVWGDGRRLYQSGVKRGNMPGEAIEVPVENVRTLTLVVNDAGDGIGSDHADWADARFEGVERVKYLSDMGWVKATNGSGPVERDRTNGGATSKDGERIHLRGQRYNKGLGTFPAAEIHFDLDKKYERFSTVVGIDDAAGNSGSAIFEVWNGTTRLHRSAMLRGGGAVEQISLTVTNVEDLILKVLDGGDGVAKDFADWADAKLLPLGSDIPPVIPPAPAGLTATPGVTQVKLAWTAAPGATSYNIYRGATAGGQATAAIASVSGTSYTNTGLTNGVEYFYKVRGVSVLGVGAPSNEASAKPTAAPPPKPTTAPTLSGTAGDKLVSLNWTAATGATSYTVYRNGTAVKADLTVLNYTDTGLTNGTTYAYRVAGVNGGGAGPQSNSLSLKPAPPVVPVPTTAPALSGTAGDKLVTLNFTAATGATSYNVYRNGTMVKQGHTTLTYSDTGLTNGTTYNYRVAGVNAGGAGPLSNTLSLKPVAPLPTVAPVLTLVSGDKQVKLDWTAATGATAYNVYRNGTLLQGNVNALTFTNTGLTNGTTYRYKVAGTTAGGVGPMSNEPSATPQVPAPTGAPTLTATPGDARVILSWTAVAGATGYRVTRGTTVIVPSQTALTYTNTGLTNGTAYTFKVAALTGGGAGPDSAEATATPLALPVAPTGLTAVGGNTIITLNWTAVPGATSYRVYRGTAANAQGATALAADIAAATYVNAGVTNGTTYFYKVTAVNASGESPRSAEANAAGLTPPPTLDPTTLSMFRFLRQATWGPKPGEVAAVLAQGRNAFLDAQFAAPASDYPDVLYDSSVEVTQEHFMRLGLTGQDQLRQRMAWALHKIWVVSAVEVNRADAIVNYQRILMNRAFGNYRDLMRDITLNPAMGRYLNMVNNRSQAITGVAPNENYAREIMQLFSLGLTNLDPNTGAPGAGAPYTETDVAELARIFTGWTFGDGNTATIPTNLAGENWRVPMEAVERFHDVGAKTFLGRNFIPGRTTRQDLDDALDTIFNHPNLPPFVCRQLIQQLVTSNPTVAHLSEAIRIFKDNGSGVRGDLRAVVRSILTHPDANLGVNPAGKLQEPVLFVLSQVRALNANVADHPFMTDLVEEMGQKVFYPPSVFSYFSPGARIRGTTLAGPEFQGLTSVTALQRVNFAGRLISGNFGGDVVIDYSAFTSRAADPAALVDYCSALLMGGQMSTDQRNEIINAVRVTPATNTTERVRTALYLVLVSAQFQVDR